MEARGQGMKRTIVVLAITILMLVGFAPSSQAAQVYCRVPTTHKVVCYNFTPYRVYMNVTVHTAYGARYFRFWNAYTKWTKYFAPVVYSVNWKWHF
jgi:hypothetical protein